MFKALSALNGSALPGHGREGVKTLLETYLPAGSRVSALEPLTDKHAEILAKVTALMAPKVEEPVATVDEDPFA